MQDAAFASEPEELILRTMAMKAESAELLRRIRLGQEQTRRRGMISRTHVDKARAALQRARFWFQGVGPDQAAGALVLS